LRFGKIEGLATRVGAAIAAASKFLFSQQHDEGYWCGELEADTTLESDYILLHTLLGTGNPERFQKAANWILQHQNEDGGCTIYEISSWSRAILVPLSICYAKKPFKKIPREMGVEELFVGGMLKSRMHLHWAKKLISWRNFFLVIDRMVHWFERVHVRPLRSIALRSAEKWMLARLEMSDGLAAIYPAMMNAIIALRCLGYSLDDPQVIRALDEFEKLGIAA